MHSVRLPLVRAAALLLFALCLSGRAHAEQKTAAPQERTATVNGVKLHYVIAGHGPPVVLLHGFAEDSRMWRPLIPELAKTHTVVAPDLRGSGGSERPASGYEKKSMAQDIHALTDSLGYRHIELVGHDIGLMVAYAYAAQYPEQVDRIVLMDAFLPGVGNWMDTFLLQDLWHFHFFGETPLKLVTGRERIYLDHFWNDFAADRNHSVPEEDRRHYAESFAKPGGIQAGFGYFKAFPQDAKDFAGFAGTKLQMPMLVITGEKASGQTLIDQAHLVATNVRGEIVPGTGHWLMEEAPEKVIPMLVGFLNEGATAQRERLTPGEIDTRSSASGGAGTSGVEGIRTTVLKGDPTKPGLYTIELHIPANTRIAAHTHPDDRVATVTSGTWFIGYGDRFDESALKPLTAGSFYTEPPGEPHFARTGAEPVVVQISGVGPTGTMFIAPEPRRQARQAPTPATQPRR